MEVSGRFLNSLRSLQQQQQASNALNSSSSQRGMDKPDDSLYRSDVDLANRMHDRSTAIAAILAERGASCSSNKELFRQTLKDTGIPLSEDQLAGIIVVLVNRFVNASVEHAIDESNKWNLDVVADVLSVEAKGLNWTAVVHYFDLPQLVIRSEAIFVFIARMFVRIAGMPLPAAGLVGNWNNKHAQLTMLILSANAPRNLVDFFAIVSAEQSLPGEVPMPGNYSWLSMPLYTTLLQLASSGFSHEVLEALTTAASNYPEYVTICLAQVQDPNSGVRAEILRRTLPLFSGLPGSKATSMIVMRKLSSTNPDLLVLLFRIALKRANKVQDIIDIDIRIKNFGNLIAKRLEDEAGIDENLGYWCVKADRTDFNIEARIASALEINPQQNCRALLNFIKQHAESLRPRGADGGLLSFECFAVMLRALQQYPSIVSIDELRSLASLITQHQLGLQHAANVLPPQPGNQSNMLSQAGLLNQGQLSNQSNLMMNSQAMNSGISQGSLGQILQGQGNLEGIPGHGLGERAHGPEADDIDEEANGYFQKLYTSDISVTEGINLLKRFKSSTEKREQEIFRCMIHNLFDEYRFFHKYPDKELHLTGNLFGALIQHQLVSSITLGIALRYVLEALRKDPDLGGSNEKMFRFGKIALDQFRSRLVEWPQYCSHLIQIPHFARHCPELNQEVQRALNNPTPPQGAQPFGLQGAGDFSGPIPTAGMMMQSSQQQLSTSVGSESSQASLKPMSMTDESQQPMIGYSPGSQPMLPMISRNISSASDTTKDKSEESSAVHTPLAETIDDPNLAAAANLAASTVVKISVIDRMALVNVELANTIVPPENTRDKMHMIVNNIDKSNVEVKSMELKALVIADYYNWFANYLVVKRISAQPNLHPLYLTLIDTLDNTDLNSVILDSTYHNATKLLLSPKITTSSTERTLLRNLGIWLGLMTLARNKPLLHRRVEVKELLYWGYETGRLIAVCSFVARILEGVRESKIFRPPNPWLMGVLGVMRELYEIEDLKMNIKFEVQVLCKNINVKIEDIPKSNTLANCKAPIKDQRNPDFNVKNAAGSMMPASAVTTPPTNPILNSSPHQMSNFNSPVMAPMQLPSQAQEDSMASGSANAAAVKPLDSSPQPTPAVPAPSAGQEQTVIPNLGSFITINPSLQFFTSNPAQRRLVSIAVDRAIRELIQPVAERSVTVASVTCKQLITKDFATEANEQHLRRSAHIMTANLAGSLALITCKEPLRLSICNHLRSLLSQATSDQPLIEQIVQVCSNDNLDIGCKLIEKAATEKAIRDSDESLSAAYQLRRKNREAGQQFIDTTVPKGVKYPRELPDALKPRLGGLTPQQLQVYDGFQRQRLQPPVPQAGGSPGVAINPAMLAGGDLKSLPPGATAGNINPSTATLSMAQALEMYQTLNARIDMAMRAVQLQAQGREISFSMLGSENEILNYLREIITITQRIQPTVRNEAAMTFAETVFKRLCESLAMTDLLKAEVVVAMFEALRDVSGGPKKLSTEIVSWLTTYSTFNLADANTQKMLRVILTLLLRVKLLRSQDIDNYFSLYMDGGRNMMWVEMALSFVKQCLSDNLAATYEFGSIFDTVSKIRPTNPNVRKHLQKILTDLRALATSREEQKLAPNIAGVPSAGVSSAAPGMVIPPAAPSSTIDAALREHVTVLLEKWLRVWSSVTESVFAQYLQLMHQHGVFKTEEAADKFFRVATELCVEASLKTAPAAPAAAENAAANLSYTVIDALSKLFILLMRLAEKESSDITVRVNLLGRILNAIARSLLDDHESKVAAGNAVFDQRPYFRLFSNIALDFGIPDAKKEPNPASLPVVATFAQVYTSLHPGVVSGFAFGWLQLISQRTFLPHLMLAKAQKGWPYIHKLLVLMFSYLQPYLKNVQLSDPIRKLYKGTLRVLLMLLHDFPEFLCEYQLSLCDVIPANCIQLRNLVLSAIPRSMRLPDPFTPNLKVDLLPEINHPPRMVADYFNILSERGIRPRIDQYLSSRQPAELPSVLSRVVMQPPVAGADSANNAPVINVPLLNAVIVYIGSLGAVQLQNKVSLPNSPALELYKGLISSLDAEGRNYVLNCMVNQLRYPNSHTHFFSYVILLLFLEAESTPDAFFQEQIARVLLERLIVHKPHPVSSLCLSLTWFDCRFPSLVGITDHLHRVDEEFALWIPQEAVHAMCTRD
jgi:CCR4-NOT transcription complex subunit 1